MFHIIQTLTICMYTYTYICAHMCANWQNYNVHYTVQRTYKSSQVTLSGFTTVVNNALYGFMSEYMNNNNNYELLITWDLH